MTAPVGRRNGKYATKPGGKHDSPSVTAVLGILNKPGLMWGAAKETALFAIHHQDEWMDLEPAAAVDRVRTHFRGIWDAKANLGTTVHGLAHQWAQGVEVDCPPDCVPYIDALERFYLDHQPTTVEAEESIVHEKAGESYGGTFDWIADLADLGRWLLDVKTGESLYPEVRWQLAAYRFSDGIAVYDDTGTLTEVRAIPTVDRCGVLHLRGDGTYDLVEVDAGKPEFDEFLALRRAWPVASKIARLSDKREVGRSVQLAQGGVKV